jgi:hypothetical protein
MTLEEIYYIGQTIAVLLVLGSLVVLIVQVRTANKLAREAANHAQSEGLQAISRALFEAPGLAGVWERGTRDLASLSNEERVQFVAFTTYTTRIWEDLHLQYLRGQVADDLWNSHLRLLSSIQQLPGFNDAWEIRRATFSPTFQKLYDGNKNNWTNGEAYGRQLPSQKVHVQTEEPTQ